MACTLAAALLGFAAPAGADTKLVTFDDQPAGATITNQYRAADGVRFDGTAASDGFSPVVRSVGMLAHSGGQVADIVTCPDCGENFPTPRTVGRLDTTASAISLYVGYVSSGGGATAHVVLTARDAAGNPLGSQEADVTEGAPFATRLEVTSGSPNIASFELTAPDDTAEPVAFDDLAITYSDTPPPPDIALSPGLGVLDVLQGNALDDPLTLNRINGSSGDVTFSVTGLPTGMTASFAPNPVPGQSTATTMTLHAADSAAFTTDYATITITATPNTAAAGPAPRSITALTRISQNCDRTVRFPYVDARSPGCFFKRGHEYATHNTDVRVNGLILKPLDGDRELDINDADKTIKSVRSTYAVAVDTDPDIPFYYGPIDWDFSAGGTANRQVIGFDISGIQQQLNGLPLTGLSAEFTPAGKAQLKPTLNLSFWPFNYFGSLTATTTFTTDNDHGPDFSGLLVKLPKVSALGIELKNVELRWQEGNTWGGQATLVLAFSHKYEVGAGFGIKNGDFDYLFGNVGGLNVAVGGGVFLQRIGFSVRREPLTLRGSVGLTAGPSIAGRSAVSIAGGFTAVLGDPFVVQVDGAVSIVDRLELARAFVRYSSTGLFEFGGSANWDFKVIYVNGAVSGWVDGLDAFNVEGSVDGCLRIDYLPDPCVGARALVSSVGIAGCLTAYGYGVGAAAAWTGDFDAFTGCDLSPWRATHSRAHAAAAPVDYTLPAGLPVAAWEVQGDGGPPGITLTGPNGETVTVNRDSPYVQNDQFVAGLGEDGTSFVFAKSPAAGRWTLSDDGTFPVKRVRSARGLPKPSVSASIGGRGRARTVSWRIKPLAGQRVRFAEIGKDVRNVIATARGRTGTARFRPADGPAGTRRIVALVEQNGGPRTTLDVASYRAPGMPRPHRVRALKITRRGSRLTVRWRAHDGRAFRHAVYLKVSDGRRLLRVLPAKRRSVVVRGIPRQSKVTATVTGLTAANGGARGAPRLEGGDAESLLSPARMPTTPALQITDLVKRYPTGTEALGASRF